MGNILQGVVLLYFKLSYFVSLTFEHCHQRWLPIPCVTVVAYTTPFSFLLVCTGSPDMTYLPLLYFLFLLKGHLLGSYTSVFIPPLRFKAQYFSVPYLVTHL